MTQKDYDTLFALSKKIRLLDSISYLLEWDQETFMPKKATGVRAEQIELMASLSHTEKTSAKFTKALAKLVNLNTGRVIAKGLNASQKAALREWHRDFRMAKALPNAFVKESARLSSEAMVVWSQARKENTFETFAPYLEKIVALNRKKAEYLGYTDSPYDALLDCFEPDTTTAEVAAIFKRVKKGIVDLLKKIQASPQIDNECLKGKFSTEKQLAFGRKLLSAMGYDLEKGRLDLSAHPFSMSLHPSDSRVTTRVHTPSIFDSLSAVLHEGGHSLYEMGMQPEYYGSPLCEAVSHGIHESQSRLWETRIGQSRPFWKHFLKPLAETFPKLKGVSLDQFYRAINRVAPTFIRVESDEVTYSLHVILRFEIERALIEERLEVRDLPEMWNGLMQELLGIIPPSDSKGCLQDIHWSMGAFGYFPTYALGNLYASQFFAAFEKEHPDWEKEMARGRLLFLRTWLQEKIHRHGKTYRAGELVKRVSGKALSEKPYLAYLNEKYRKIYKFKG